MNMDKEGVTGSWNDSSNPYKQVYASSGGSKPQITASETITMADGDTLASNSIRWYYVTNSIGYKKNGNTSGWRQRLSAIIVNGESVQLPTAFVTGASATTILQNGEARGTKVVIKNYDVESSDSGQGIKNDIQRYDVEVSNVHTDISVEMIYSPVGTQGVIWMDYASGVTPQMYVSFDYGSNYTGWIDLSPGAFYYQKYSTGTYRIRWANKQGYYNSQLSLNYNGQTTTVYSQGSSAVTQDDDGYYETNIGRSITNGDYAILTFSATPISYQVTYDGKGGTYTGGTPTDAITYDSAEKNQILVDPVRPTKGSDLFLGYRIKGEAKNTLFQPGDLIDLSDSNSIDLSGLTVQDGKANIVLEAQWMSSSDNSNLSTVRVISKKLVAKDTWESEEKDFLVAKGAKYIAKPDETINNTWAFIESNNLEGVAGQTTASPEIYYKHPTTVTYSDGGMTDYTGSLPGTENTYAYTETSISSPELKKAGNTKEETISQEAPSSGTITVTTGTTYEHIGWMDQLGNTYQSGATLVTVPWDGLNLIAQWRTTVTTTTEDITAQDFTLTQKQLKEYLAKTSDDEKKTLLIGYAKAVAETWAAATPDTKSEEEITGAETTIVASDEGGSYSVTFTTAKGTQETVTATVLPKQNRRLVLTASSFVMTLSQAKAYTLSWSTDTNMKALIENAKASAWLEVGNDKTEVSITSASTTVQAAAGFWTATFQTEGVAGTDNADAIQPSSKTVLVLVTPERIEAQNFTITLSEAAAGLDEAALISRAKGRAWNGDDETSAVEVNVDSTQSEEIKAVVGDYKLTLTTWAGTTKTVTVTVVDKSTKTEPSDTQPSSTSTARATSARVNNTATVNAAPTGDRSKPFLWLVLLLTAGIGSIVVWITGAGKRRNKSQKSEG
jgi:hypothetical protein